MTELATLKKSDFLNAVTEEPMTREQLVDALENFEFIPSYLDYLTDHFEAQGKIVKNDDGTIQRKAGKKSASARELYRVVQDEETGEYSLEEGKLGEGELEDNRIYNDEVKEAGWALTPNAAVKRVTKEIFASYKEETAAVKALLD